MNLIAAIKRLFVTPSAEVSRPCRPPAMSEGIGSDALPDGMREKRVQCLGPHGLHHMAYTEWGEPDNPNVLICVHGLTRNGRDFDALAQVMRQHYRVICPDVVGRGRSDWLKYPDDYGFPQYLADMVALIARLDVTSVHWLGTSMGGLIGMLLAALPDTPIRRLVMNDVGPVISAASLKRIGEYVGNSPTFASLDEAEIYVRRIFAPFGALTDAQWQHLTRQAICSEGSRYRLRYDPGLAEPFRKTFIHTDVKLWKEYDSVRCPTLVVRGAESDLLTHDVAQEMTRRGPGAQWVEIPGVGHAPSFMDDAQIQVVASFLLTQETACGEEQSLLITS